MPTYTVVARTRASAVFYPGKGLGVPCDTAAGPAKLEFRTTYKSGFEAPLPVDFYVQAVGDANNILDAEVHFLNAAGEIANLIAFVTNAHLGHLELELAFGCSSGMTEHDFMQRFVPMPAQIDVPGRPIDPDHVADFIDLLQKHEEKERLQRAIAQYVEALRTWNAGHELMCVVHLYMGVEALTKALLRAEKARLGVDDRGLAAAWNIDITKPDTPKLDLNKLDGEVRRRLIFQGDDACFSTVKSVSDGFEHGFSKFDAMHQPARQTVSQTAAYLRRAIVNLVAPFGQLDVILTDKNWAEPRGPVKLSKKIRGKLVGAVDALPKPGNPYPILIWHSSLKTVRFDANGRYGFAPNENITPELGKGTRLEPRTIEVWDDIVMSSRDPFSGGGALTATKEIELVVTHEKRNWPTKIRTFLRGARLLVKELFS